MSEWKSVFDANISLYVRIIVEHLLNNGWQMISINDYTRNMPSFSCMDALKTNDYQKEGLFPIVSQSKDLISGYTDNKQLVNKIDSPIIIFGDHTQVVKYIDFDFVLGADGTKILTVSKDYLPKFLYYIIKSIDLHSNKYARHYSKLRKEKIPYCKDSINIQEKIVAFLDSLAENAIEEKNYFDKIIESKIISLQKECLNICLIEKENEKQKSYAKQLRQNILQEAIEGKLTTDWRKQHPVQKGNPDYDAEALFDKMQAEKSETKSSQKTVAPVTKDEIPFEIPIGWKWARLGEICRKLTDGSHNPPPNSGKGYPVISAMNIKNGRISLDNVIRYTDENGFQRENKRTSITKGDIIMGIIGASIGNVAIYDHDKKVIAQRSIAIIDALIDNVFVLNALNSIFIQKYLNEKAFGSAQGGVYLGKISNIPFPLPSLAEQKEIVARVEQYLQTITQLESQIATRETTTKQLMQSILKDAFEEG